MHHCLADHDYYVTPFMIGLAAELIYEQSTLSGYYFSTAYTFIFLSKIIYTYTGTMR